MILSDRILDEEWDIGAHNMMRMKFWGHTPAWTVCKGWGGQRLE
jgi:hypothetical protein